MIHGIKITENTQCSCDGTQEQKFQIPFLPPEGNLIAFKMRNAKIAATKLRKKLFCIDGRSPASRTKAFIQAKQKAERRIQKIPFVFYPSFIFLYYNSDGRFFRKQHLFSCGICCLNFRHCLIDNCPLSGCRIFSWYYFFPLRLSFMLRSVKVLRGATWDSIFFKEESLLFFF